MNRALLTTCLAPMPVNISRQTSSLRQLSQKGAICRPSTHTARTPVTARYNSGKPDIPDRVVGALPYLLPLFDGLRYGKFLFMQYPVLGNALIPIEPLARLYFSVPFASIACFFAVYLGIINNPDRFSRFVRFNAMQAVLLDIVLILPGLFESVLKVRPSGGFGLQLYMTSYNTVFIFLTVCVLVGISSCMTGSITRLPFIGEAADMQVR